MKYDELLADLRGWTRVSVSYEGSIDELLDKAADAIEKLRGVIQRQREMINATAYLPLYPKPMKWIPVTERLPDVHKNVLCCGSKGGQFVGWVSNHVANGKTTAFVHGGSGRLITHWMPLPEPPESVRNPDEMEKET